uniref:Uncharacterized protein n=1 Tax=Anopheles atroparvus TaxID=41427 RepID=A0A182INQ2_ANOAO
MASASVASKRPTILFGGSTWRACSMKPLNTMLAGKDSMSSFSVCPLPITVDCGVMRKGVLVVSAGMPPPWNGSMLSQTEVGAPLGRAYVGAKVLSTSAKQSSGSIVARIVLWAEMTSGQRAGDSLPAEVPLGRIKPLEPSCALYTFFAAPRAILITIVVVVMDTRHHDASFGGD